MYVSFDSLLKPTPASFVALHTYTPSSFLTKHLIVNDGHSIVPPEYFSCNAPMTISSPWFSFVHLMINGDGLPDMLHSIVWLYPFITFFFEGLISSFSFSKIKPVFDYLWTIQPWPFNWHYIKTTIHTSFRPQKLLFENKMISPLCSDRGFINHATCERFLY